MTTADDATFLSSSPERARALAALSDAPASPAALADDLDLSRRTAQRHLSAFADRDWARKAGGEYALTTTGALVARTHATYLDALDAIDRHEPLFAHLSDPADAPDPSWLDDTHLVASTPENPQAPVQYYLEAVGELDASTVRMLSPVLSRLYHDAHADLAKGGTHTELVLPAGAVERARSENPIEFRAVLGLGVLDLYRTEESIGVGLTCTDDRALVCAYGDDGQLAAVLDATDDRVLGWATDVFERYRDGAERVGPPGPGRRRGSR
ncbi:ArsR family transcriptional regulator [Halorubellus sp. JP-L1]|uniref:helix-turn-helix transcriptional regulator n=1 Tax=Halorubellus sp. JP-L1 TaxID=2715753 RepID=UPI00140B5994|nr:ArsR family transcriptional regulator [Halorubellus sp. JP-L1]NHN43145.1 ArsR family transcriptional regulator [Halorubellus sp. JP-L1]